ncbi:oxidoreductase YdhF [Paraliobacillus ryukyuensis]|uniref:Putative oxidoreductase n=1 Tax=Paraliobacillus ryukyuensis TaxID=200904 RepID=A0A366EJ56_9BACI|nr:aldo/keto reductase [Paraliobacillus ryukyuensis]RBP01455.1 putative oxidoreductase [Paraliobacillus ryukyuensis]
MKKLRLGSSDLEVSEISLGCMRMSSLSKKDAAYVVENALDLGVDFFDHADIYGAGESEEVFAQAIDMNPSIRKKIFLQSKCGIRKGFFDFSKDHIISSVEGNLNRLNTDYLDVLLLHRPDALMEPEEVAEAFTKLKAEGKVRYFGVSNQNPYQMELLSKYLEDDLIVNQMQLSLLHTPMIDAGLNVNMGNESGIDRDNGILEYCRLNNITVQAWSPFQYGLIKGPFIDNSDFPEVNAKLTEFAEKKGVTNSAIAIAWILRHPANIQPVVGTMNPERLQHIEKATNVALTREEWYELYRAAGNVLP